ncbi:hypothetical protein ABNQ39_06970 [Azospirillum sp. A26]|uniref:hypothetical protein n=1 Tax=Azospirillum sp. A26 TaxID=3160607 RepID=UPI003672D030
MAVDLERLFLSMMDRMDWRVGGNVLRYSGLRPSHGWLGTIAKFRNAARKLAIGQKEGRRLYSVYRENLACGDRYIRFYDVSEQQRKALIQWALNLNIEASVFSRAFPYMLTEAQLGSIEPNKSLVSAVEEYSTGYAVFFAANRVHHVRERIDTDKMTATVSKVFEQYDEVIGVKVTRKQAMDVVWLPKSHGPIEVRIDVQACPIVETSMSAHEDIRQIVNASFGVNILKTPVNLFPSIKKLYDSPKEGTVVEMAFLTGTASIKHETMRKTGKCLREEKFHEAGVDALEGDIRAYLISITWPHQFGSDYHSFPEANLRGTSRLLDELAPKLHDLSIRRAWGLADFDLARNKVLAHL